MSRHKFVLEDIIWYLNMTYLWHTKSSKSCIVLNLKRASRSFLPTQPSREKQALSFYAIWSHRTLCNGNKFSITFHSSLFLLVISVYCSLQFLYTQYHKSKDAIQWNVKSSTICTRLLILYLYFFFSNGATFQRANIHHARKITFLTPDKSTLWSVLTILSPFWKQEVSL